VITISGETRQQEQRDGSTMERYVSFYRQLRLPDDVDPDKIEASYENGVLTIRVPREAQRDDAKRIPVNTASRGQQETTEKAA
jgi:HSP20 family protein